MEPLNWELDVKNNNMYLIILLYENNPRAYWMLDALLWKVRALR